MVTRLRGQVLLLLLLVLEPVTGLDVAVDGDVGAERARLVPLGALALALGLALALTSSAARLRLVLEVDVVVAQG